MDFILFTTHSSESLKFTFGLNIDYNSFKWIIEPTPELGSYFIACTAQRETLYSTCISKRIVFCWISYLLCNYVCHYLLFLHLCSNSAFVVYRDWLICFCSFPFPYCFIYHVDSRLHVVFFRNRYICLSLLRVRVD